MALEDFAAQLGYVNRPDEGGRAQWYNGDMRLRNGEDGGTLSTLLPWYDRFTTTMDAQGRPVFGTDARAEGQSEVFQGPDGRAYLRVDNPQLTEQHREVGGKPSDLIYDPQKGYGIEVGLQERWARQFQQDDTLEKIANNMPIIMGIIFGGAAASGALGGAGAAAGEGAAVGGGAGAAGGGAAGTLPEAYWSMLAGDASAAAGSGAGTAAAGTGAAGALGGAGGIGTAGSVLSASELASLGYTAADMAALGLSAGEIAAATGGVATGVQAGVGAGGAMASAGGALGSSGAGSTATGSGFFDLAKSALGTPGVSQLLSGGLQSLGGYLGSRAQANAVGNANDLLWRQYQQNREDLTPYRMAGYGALGGLVDMTTPGKQLDRLRLDPGYDFRRSEGQQALDSKLRAGGKFYSGTGIKAAADYNQNFASNEFNNAYNRLAGLAGTGQAAANSTAQLGQNTANTMANNTVDIGNARASGYGAIAGGLSGALNSYQNAQQTQQLFDLLSKRS